MLEKDIERIALIQSTCELHRSSDINSLTRELFSLHQEIALPLPIRIIKRKVNQSWKNKGLAQRCTDDILETGDSWKNVVWPSGDINEGIEGDYPIIELTNKMEIMEKRFNEKFENLNCKVEGLIEDKQQNVEIGRNVDIANITNRLDKIDGIEKKVDKIDGIEKKVDKLDNIQSMLEILTKR